jgi:pimeloyl-ACP methyl ester carboxylesterase
MAGLPPRLVSMSRGFSRAVDESPRGDGHTVLVIPGFTANDATTIPLRSFLGRLGYRTDGWGLGFNLGIKPEDEPKLEAQVERLAADGPITVIGWSLGGVFAREIARRRPDLVRRVITLGTPIRGREGTAWIVRVFKLLNPAAEDELTDEGAARHAMPIDVPMTAVYSLRDGVVDGRACRVREEDEGPDAENVEVDTTHIGMGFDLDVFRIIADRLAADSEQLSRTA